MSTVKDLITGSMRLLGITDPVENLSAEQQAVGLAAFNALLDAWNTDEFLSYTINRTVYPLTIAKQSYTLGTGGDFDYPRPAAIENISILLTNTTPNIEIPIKVDQDEDWQGITVKSVASSYPTEVYPDGGFPFNTLYFWPIPSAACSVVLYTWNKIASYALNDTLTLPPGYERALRFNLAVELAPEFGLNPPQTVFQTAVSSKYQLKKLNWTPREMSLDPMFRSNGGSSIGQKSRGAVVDP